MIKNYKAYANELYSIKVSMLPKVTIETASSMTLLLNTINELRAQLRKNLNELCDEYMLATDILPDTLKNNKKVNDRMLSKLYILAYNLKKKIKAVQ